MQRQAGHWAVRQTLLGGVVAAALALTLSGCAEIEVPTAEPYEPAALESTGPDQPAKITFTEEAVRRIALQTTTVQAQGGDLAVDHAALIFDKQGKPWVFTVVAARTYTRASVKIKDVADNLAILSSGPPAGTKIVTVGAAQLWGAELGIAGKH